MPKGPAQKPFLTTVIRCQLCGKRITGCGCNRPEANQAAQEHLRAHQKKCRVARRTQRLQKGS